MHQQQTSCPKALTHCGAKKGLRDFPKTGAAQCSGMEPCISLKQQWAMQADLTALKGGQEWAARRWDSDTLAFYNRAAFAAWLAARS